MPPRQKQVAELLERYEYMPRPVGAEILGVSRECFRCALRRMRAKKWVESANAGRFNYSYLTVRGAAACGISPPRSQVGHASLYVRFAIAAWCSAADQELLKHAEFCQILEELEPQLGPLAVAGLPRRVWYVDKEERLALLYVDLSAGESTAHSLCSRIVQRVSKLAKKSEAWTKIVASSRLAVTVLSAIPNEVELRVAAREAGVTLPLSVAHVPILADATGLATQEPAEQ